METDEIKAARRGNIFLTEFQLRNVGHEELGEGRNTKDGPDIESFCLYREEHAAWMMILRRYHLQRMML